MIRALFFKRSSFLPLYFVSLFSCLLFNVKASGLQLPNNIKKLPVGEQWRVFDSILEHTDFKSTKKFTYLLSTYRNKKALNEPTSKSVEGMIKFMADLEKSSLTPIKAQRFESWLLKESSNEKNEIQALGFHILATEYKKIGMNGEALEFYIRAFEKYRLFDTELFPFKSKCWFEYASHYYYFRDFTTTRKLLQSMWKNVPDKWIYFRISSLNTIALCYRHEGDIFQADQWFKKAMNEAEKVNDEVWIGILKGNLGYSLMLKKKYAEAEPLIEEGIALNRKNGINMDLAFSLSNLSQVKLIQGDKNESYRLILEAVELMESKGKINDFEIKSRLFIPLGKSLVALGKYNEGFEALEDGRIAQDSLNAQRSALQMAGVQLKIEAEKHIKSLKTKEREIYYQRVWIGVLALAILGVSIFTWIFFKQKRKIAFERKRSDALLMNILPEKVAEELKASGESEPRLMDQVTVLFTDFKGFTKLSEELSAKELVSDLNEFFSEFDKICERNGVEKIKTIGDGYMAASGLPEKCENHAHRAINAGLEMISFVTQRKQQKIENGLPYFDIRVGLHTGPVVAGIVGLKKFQYDIWGDTVNTASRMESSGEIGRINVSNSTYQLIKNDFECEFRGEIEAKGKGEMEMWYVNLAFAN